MIYNYIFIGWNIFVMLIYGGDKLSAKLRKKRIREAVLLWSAILVGGIGALFGMLVFNHKTNKPKFWVVALISAAIWGIAYYVAKRSGLI